MKYNGNNICFKRGESFTLDFRIENKNGEPYILNSNYSNPYVLIQVKSSKYDNSLDFVKNYWLNLSNVRKFDYTRPVKLPNFDSLPQEYAEDNNYLFTVDGTSYKYWDVDSLKFESYEPLRIIKNFNSSDTLQYEAKDYCYSVFIVSGELTSKYLENLCDEYNVEFVSHNLSLVYEQLKRKNVDVDIDVNYPIQVSTKIPVLVDEKFSVIP